MGFEGLRGCFHRRAGRLVAGLVAAASLGSAVTGSAAEWKNRFWFGVRLGDFLPADEQSGGFRFFSGAFGSGREASVHLEEVPHATLSFGYGVKKWGRCQMTLEVEASRFTSGLGKETGWIDENGSTRVAIPGTDFPAPDRVDERFVRFALGEATLTPVFANVLFHWSGRNDPEKADFYTGFGLGMILAEFEESARYREFAGDIDGSDDIAVDDVAALNIKLGANVRLSRNRNWYMYFEGSFYATQVFGSQDQLRWPGVDAFLGTRDYDSDGDGADDVFGFPSDLHVMDPGKVRLDGASAGVGIRYRFGKRTGSAAAGSGEAAED